MVRKNSIVSSLVLSVAITSGTSFANANSSEGAFLESAVMAGKDIRVILDLSRCIEHGTQIPGPAVRGSVRPDTFMILSDHSIAFSNTHFTVPADNKPVQEFMKYRANGDGKFEFQTMVLDPINFSVLRKNQYDCEVNKGVKFFW